ncbi:MAG TPA: DNA-directed RNA polymerase subunit beta [Candidatus Cloacimonadota bacterium]|nr:DNA-directed RNA polymerase subunit beta [Candidatus Cloacimonadota bacterium]
MLLKKQIKSYSRITKRFEELGIQKVEVPNLIQAQIDSYNDFLQAELHPSQRAKKGMQSVFEQIFPISDTKGLYRLEFIEYMILKEKYDIDECVERNLTYDAPVKAKMELICYDEEVLKQTGQKHVKNVIEQEVYLGNIPLITQLGTFIINGAERVIISQLHRSPGVFFTEERQSAGKETYAAKIIPFNGSWLEFSIDSYETMHVYIDKKRKFPVSVLLRCLGLSENHEIRNKFYISETIETADAKGRYLYENAIDPKNGEVLADAAEEITPELQSDLLDAKIKKIKVLKAGTEAWHKIIENTLAKDNTTTQTEAAQKIFSIMRPGEEISDEAALAYFEKLIFDEKRYNLGEVGRYKLNQSLGLDTDQNTTILTADDIFALIDKLIKIYAGVAEVDDIDHLENRRIRTVGELLEEQYVIGLYRVARTASERMNLSSLQEEPNVHDLINCNALIGVVNSFFLTGQLSQFMEQTNPLAAIKHKRSFSALGPGGLTRERAGFEVRDVHFSHYGRICPVETPEGANIGLIVSPSLFSSINRLGFLETPYIKVENGRVTNEIYYLNPTEEDKYVIGQATANIDDDSMIMDEYVLARFKDEFIQVSRNDIQYMDVSPQQIVSVSAALIPFLEHDDGNRALMGSNMQRQAVPLLNPEAPVVGTGLESVVAQDSGACLTAPYDGIVEHITSSYIDLKRKDANDDQIDLTDENRIYLKKYLRSNQDTCFNQRPIVEVGQEVKAGDIITDGPCVEDNRLALGRNMLVAFMPWYGYNYEDAIILSEKVAREDILTSIYIEVKELLVRNTKNGTEKLAYDIPNVPVVAARNLDKTGIIRVGSVIKAGDIIVGKITPKSSEIDPSPEESLMRALFGDRAGDFTNTSLKAKPGMEGIVIDVKVFSRLEDIKDFEEEKKDDIARLKREKDERVRRVDNFLKKKLSELLEGEVAKTIMEEKQSNFIIAPGKKITKEDIKKINFKKLNLDFELVENHDKNQIIYYDVIQKVKHALEDTDNIYKKKRERLKHGDELPYGVRKMVKVYIAKKRKIQVGDKMAGRHGNKGVISKICPIEDMPFLDNGEPVDIILNTLGVPSRMNIGQIMETHLGMAAKTLGFDVETPVFDGAEPEDIQNELRLAGLPEDGKRVLYDGKTGERFKENVTVGIIYMLKLNHLVADKMHARSTGPYSLITQQPLGGKAQHGGQRLGEMEVWALEAYGAAYLLEEMLTLKSDDVEGRISAYKAITSGQNVPKPGTPESFNVLISELKSLCFDIDFVMTKDI